MKWYAGFETAQLHWNGNCMAAYSGHTPQAFMRENYAWAKERGFVGARDGLAWNRPIRERAECVPEDMPVVWSFHHFGRPPEHPTAHVAQCLEVIGSRRPLVVPVVEPAAGRDVSGLTVDEAVTLALTMIHAMEGRADVLTADPVHRLEEYEWGPTDDLVETGAVTHVGVHCYAHLLEVPLQDVVRAAKDRYGLPVVIGETGYHEGHWGNADKPHGCRSREEWVAYVEREAVEAEWATWMPVLPINWEGGEPWPSSWPR